MSLQFIFPVTVPLQNLTNVTPFSYRDGYTFLDKLEAIAKVVNQVVNTVNSLNDVVNTINTNLEALSDSIDSRFVNMREELSDDLGRLRADLEELITDAVPAGVVRNPVDGKIASVEDALGSVYDNARVHAWFAVDIDTNNLTAAEIDALALSARHHDLSPTDLTTNDALIK